MMSESLPGVNKRTVKVWFSDFWRPATIEYIHWNALYKFLARHFNLVLDKENPDFLFYSCFGYDYLKYDCIRIFFTGENIQPNLNVCDYAFSFNLDEDERNYRLPLYRLHPKYEELKNPRTMEDFIPENRKFCSFLVSNADSKERIEFFNLLNKYKKVESGGNVCNNIGRVIPRGEEIVWMKGYRFNICFENSSSPGYTTEKILHAFLANTIPIYWGNPLIAQDFNSQGFINCHEYSSIEEVVDVIKRIDMDEEIFVRMLNQPIFPDGLEPVTCREERITERFDRIFSSEMEHVPGKQKRMQRGKYPFLMANRVINRKIKPSIKKLIST